MSKLQDLLKRKFFITPSYEIYGGSKGFFDYGPPGATMLANLTSKWRREFIDEDQLLEITSSIITPEKVFEISGHVDRFTDKAVLDTNKNEYYRADHLLQDVVTKLMEQTPDRKDELQTIYNQADSYSSEELNVKFKELEIKMTNGEDYPDVFDCKMMFETKIGPNSQPGENVAYLRPETAQGIIVNYKRLLEYNRGKLPFAAATIGTSFRNEIAPRGGLIRLREFRMAEIEYFVEPNKKIHPKSLPDQTVILWDRDDQVRNIPAQSKLISKVANQIIGYYIGKGMNFLRSVGIPFEKIRFRQHLINEMAHYANDCWDIEILINDKWVEVAGIADRGFYDLGNHSSAKETSLKLKKPIHIIEPSFGLDRIMMAIWDCAFFERSSNSPDAKTKPWVLSLVPELAPVKCAILGLNKDAKLRPYIDQVIDIMKDNRIIYRVDDTGARIGKRYARFDEIGCPFCVTIDYDTLDDDMVTIRERDSMLQRRIRINKLKSTLKSLISGKTTFA